MLSGNPWDKQAEVTKRTQTSNRVAARDSERRKPLVCQSCHRQARPGCLTCRVCFQQRTATTELFLNQGCPFLNVPPIRRLLDQVIQWAAEYPGTAKWILDNLECAIENGSQFSRSTRAQVLGWKGGKDLNEPRTFDGNSLCVVFLILGRGLRY